MNRISAAAGSVLDLNDLLETVYREVTPIFEADAFFIALYDARADSLDFRIQVDEGLREPQMREPLGSGLTSRVVSGEEAASRATTSSREDRRRAFGPRRGAAARCPPPGSACPCSWPSGSSAC